MGQVADFLEQQRAAIAEVNPAGRLARRLALLLRGQPKQFHLQDIGGGRLAMNGGERRIAALAPAVNRAGEAAFAGAGLAANENHRLAGGGATREVECALHGRTGTGEIRFGIHIAKSNLKRLDPTFEHAPLGDFAGYEIHLRRREGLGQIIRSAALHRLDGGIDRSIGGNDHYPGPWIFRQQTGNEIQPVIGSETEIEEDQVEDLPGGFGEGIVDISMSDYMMTGRFQT